MYSYKPSRIVVIGKLYLYYYGPSTQTTYFSHHGSSCLLSESQVESRKLLVWVQSGLSGLHSRPQVNLNNILKSSQKERGGRREGGIGREIMEEEGRKEGKKVDWLY